MTSGSGRIAFVDVFVILLIITLSLVAIYLLMLPKGFSGETGYAALRVCSKDTETPPIHVSSVRVNGEQVCSSEAPAQTSRERQSWCGWSRNGSEYVFWQTFDPATIEEVEFSVRYVSPPFKEADQERWSGAKQAIDLRAGGTGLESTDRTVGWDRDSLIMLSSSAGAGPADADGSDGCGPNPGETFRDSLSDSSQGPEMVVVPAGSFMMGALENEEWSKDDERPQRKVTIGYEFAVGKYEVTWDEWDACVADRGCEGSGPEDAGSDEGWGKGSRPVINVEWNDAKAYVRWLSDKTGERYRLLSEAEWEYVARAGTTTRFSWVDGDPTCSPGVSNGANFRSCTSNRTEPVGFSAANAFGLHDMHGNVSEWVEDCYVKSYYGAPTDGPARVEGDCSLRVFRGGSWHTPPMFLRSANRDRSNAAIRSNFIGFRVARTLQPL